VEDSDGRIKGFFIWPHHRVDGESLIYPQGRRYPKRLRLYKHQLENKAIYVGGVEIGFLISNIPYMHAQALEGMGMPISQQTRAA